MIVLFWSSWVESQSPSRGRKKVCTEGVGLDPGSLTHDCNILVADTEIANRRALLKHIHPRRYRYYHMPNLVPFAVYSARIVVEALLCEFCSQRRSEVPDFFRRALSIVVLLLSLDRSVW
jgi:hypothetical protein